MCLAVPGKVIKIEGHKAIIKYPSDQCMALVGYEKIKAGDFVLVQMGIVVKILTPKEAASAQKVWKEN